MVSCRLQYGFWRPSGRRRCALLLLTAVGLAPGGAAHAGTTPAEDDGESYADRLIADGDLEPITSIIRDKPSVTRGNPRSLNVELGGSRIVPRTSITGVDTARLDRVQEEVGVSVSGRYQTDNYGMIGLDAQLYRGIRSGPFGSPAGSDWSGSATLTSRGLPLGDGLTADSALGVVSTPPIDLMRRQSRFFLPTAPVRGGAVTLNAYRRLTPAQAAQEPSPYASLHLAIGQPGLLGGMRLSDFTQLSGLSIAGGGQIDVDPGVKIGFQAITLKDARDPYAVIFQPDENGSGQARYSSSAALGTVALAAGNLRLQANGIWSRRADSGGRNDSMEINDTAGGVWLDGNLRSGRTVHTGGVYYFEPRLMWGGAALLNNAYGGYYRLSASSQRWRWTVNLDAVDSVDGLATSGVIASVDARRKLSFDTSLGVNAIARVANGQTTLQLLGFIDFPTDLGTSRAEAGWSRDPVADIYRIGFNQSWALGAWLPAGSHLSTQVALDHRRQSEVLPDLPDVAMGEKSTSFAAAVSFGATPRSWFNLDATLAYNSNASSAVGAYGPFIGPANSAMLFSSRRGEAFSATVGAALQLSSTLSLTASYSDTTSSLTSRFGLPDLGQLPPFGIAADDARRSTFRLRAGYLTVRYSIASGQRNGRLGAREYPVGGTGNLEGHVYLDANDSRSREPSEAGVSGIVLILDGIQAVKTDSAGRYRFEGISDGPHRITLNVDALPLPWAIEADDKRGTGESYVADIDVGVRSTVRLDIAAARQ